MTNTKTHLKSLKMKLTWIQLIRKLPKKTRKTAVAPYKISKRIRSNKQALNEILNGLKELAESSVRQHQMTIAAEQKSEERYMTFLKEE